MKFTSNSGGDCGFGFRVQGACFDVPGETKKAKGGDAVPVGIELVPGEAVTGGLRVSVVVVVPAFAKGEQRDPETVARGVGCGEAA